MFDYVMQHVDLYTIDGDMYMNGRTADHFYITTIPVKWRFWRFVKTKSGQLVFVKSFE